MIKIAELGKKYEEIGGLTAVILAGGLGTRLKPAVDDRPKALAPINGRPFLEYLFDKLIASGVTRCVLCTGYRADQIQKYFGNRYNILDIAYSEEKEQLGTAGALKLALPHVHTSRVLVLNGDSYINENFSNFFSWHINASSDASILLTEVKDIQRYGAVSFAPTTNEIFGFEEKGGATGAGWINSGVYIFSTDLLHSIPSGRAVSLEKDMFPVWVKARWLFGYPAKDASFIDIGTPESLTAAQEFFPSKRFHDYL